MKTQFLKINPAKIDHKKINLAAKLIKSGKLVAFPTETVYGLGANALDKNAVLKIYKAKGRPSDNPLIVHIANKNDLSKLALNISENAQKLIDNFWPGPLTLIFKKTTIVPNETTAGIDTVAVRMPVNPIVLALIKSSGVPIAAPSANLFSKPSPTSAEHVLDDLNGKIDMIIDGGNTQIGLESTVVDMTSKYPIILRPGGVTLEQIQKIILGVKLHPSLQGKKIKINHAKSPGLKYKHYAPKAKIILFRKSSFDKIPEFEKKLKEQNKKVKIIKTENTYEFSKNLFKIFREADKEKVDYILITQVEEKGIGLAIMNRIKKATYQTI
jgi:L-threonylcarbamoyladenylate synthase